MWIGYFLTFALFLYLQIWLHEIGHAVAGWATGYEVTSLGTGRGKPLFVWSWRGLRFFVCRESLFSGVAFVFPKEEDLTRGAKVLMYAGGVIANFLTASVIAVILHFAPDNGILWLNLGIASLLVVGNIIPRRSLTESYGGQTDGAAIIDIIWPRKRPAATSYFRDKLSQYQAIVTFLQEIGDTRGSCRYGASLIPSLLYYDELEAAKRMLPLLASAAQTDAKLCFEYALLRAKLALQDKDDIAASEALDEADVLYAEEYGKEHWRMLQWTRFAWLLRVERPAEALEIIDSLSKQYSFEKDAEIAIPLLACRLYAVLDLHGLDQGLGVYEEYQRKRSLCELVHVDLNVAHIMAKAYAKIEDWTRADSYYRAALDHLVKMEYLPRSDKELIDDAQECFERMGQADDLAIVNAKEILIRPRNEKLRLDKIQARQDDLLRRTGKITAGCLFWNLLIHVLAGQSGSGVDFGEYLSKFSLVAAIVILPLYAYARYDRGFRPFAAPMVVFLTALPWAAALLIMHSI